MKKRILIALTIVIPIILLLPLVASAAITDSQVIAILNTGIAGVVDLVKVAYCAAGVAALC